MMKRQQATLLSKMWVQLSIRTSISQLANLSVHETITTKYYDLPTVTVKGQRAMLP